MRKAANLLLLLTLWTSCSHAFVVTRGVSLNRRSDCRHKPFFYLIKASQKDDDEEAGRELARQFYKYQQQANKASPSNKKDDDERSNEMLKDSATDDADSSAPIQVTKFTGRSSSLFQEPDKRSPRQRMVEREINLASRFEQTFLFQVGFVLILAVVMATVGLTGGITNERDFGGYDEINIMGEDSWVQTDQTSSVFI